MARSDPQVNIRIPEELLDQLREAIARSGRSVTGEIVYRLYESFSGRDLTNEKIAELTLQMQNMQKSYERSFYEVQERRLLNESKIRVLENALERLQSK